MIPLNPGTHPSISFEEELGKGITDRKGVRYRTGTDVSDADLASVKEAVRRFQFETGAILDRVIEEDRDFRHEDFGKRINEHFLLPYEWEYGRPLDARRFGIGVLLNAVGGFDETLKKRIECVVVSEDLADPENSRGFSYAIGLYPVAILSIARVRQFERRGVSRHDYLRVVAFHELGHIFGLVNRVRNVSLPGGPIGENHCLGESGRCAMQQGDCGNLDAAVQISEVCKKTRWLCDDCLVEVRDSIRSYRNKGSSY